MLLITAVKGTLEYQACREGQCVMFDEEFSIKINDAKVKVEAASVDKKEAEKMNLCGCFSGVHL